MKTTAIIPARYGSTRLPGKPLIDIKGKPLIQYVYERAQASLVDQVIVATDDERIMVAVKGFGGEAVLTSPHHKSGTERVAEVAEKLDSDIVVNIQGDEPLLKPEDIHSAISPFIKDTSNMMTTLITPLAHSDDFTNPHVVKVTVDKEGFALYFSRSPIPYPASLLQDTDSDQPKGLMDLKVVNKKALKGYWQHIGLYAFQRDFLLKVSSLPPTPLEEYERLEQLRVLEHGFKIKTVVVSEPSIGIDTPEDLERFKSLI